ncbi:MAG: hypothetical protein QOH96_3943 [Blastocatellia bacterium]|nr:hypothetical protein [Blastocatellia bacterium]
MTELQVAENGSPEYQVRANVRNARRDWIAVIVLVLAPLVVYGSARIFPELVERFYSRGVYPYIGRSIGSVSGLVPFSLAELGLLCLLALMPVFVFWYIKSVRRRAETWSVRAGVLLRRSLCALGILALVFQLMWGLNYGRLPLASSLAFDRSRPDAAELEQIAHEIVDQTNKYYHVVHNEDPSMSGTFDDRAALEKSIEESYSKNQLLPWPASLGGFASPKPVLLHDLMARFGIAGMYSPFTGEPNYVETMPGFDLPSTMAHEMAHARGFAREDEADFVSFVICTSSSDPRLKYSGYLSGLRILSQLAGLDMQRYRELAKLIEDGPKRDLKARYEFWARYSGKTSYLGNRVNDFYLKANGIKSGVKNYDEVSALIIGYFRRFKGASPQEANFARVFVTS